MSAKNRMYIKKGIKNTPVIGRLATGLNSRVTAAKHKNNSRIYQNWISDNSPSKEALDLQRLKSKKFSFRPLISIVTPVFDTSDTFLTDMFESVLNQTYDNWELIVIDDCSPREETRQLIKKYALKDQRIKYEFLKKNLHIAGATNHGIKICSGEFVALLDHDDVLQPDALFEIARVLNQNESLDFIYTDEDKIDVKNIRNEPFFKPDYNQDFLYSVNYITHFTTIRKKLLDKIGLEREAYNGAQDWDLILRATRSTSLDKIHHIPKILYSWRVHDRSTASRIEAKPYVVEAQRKAINDDLQQRKITNYVLKRDELYHGQWRLDFTPDLTKGVSIILETPIYQQAKNEIGRKTTYQNFEVCEGSLKTITQYSSSDYVIFSNQQLKIEDTYWINVLLGDAMRQDIGFVLAYLTDNNVSDVLSSLLGVKEQNLLEQLGESNVSNHLYRTARYNINDFDSGLFMIGKDKLVEVLKSCGENANLRTLTKQATKIGYRNLYNPYVKVIK